MQGKGREAEMTSKSSTSNGEEEDDCGTFVPWLDLIFGVDNTSTDIILSNEELLTERFDEYFPQ